jgi:DNA modification methylase
VLRHSAPVRSQRVVAGLEEHSSRAPPPAARRGPEEEAMTDPAPKVVNDGYELVAVKKLKFHPENPNKGKVEAIEESIGENGFFGAVLVQRSSGRILGGEHTVKAAKKSGLEKVPVIWLDVDDARALKILLAANRTRDLAKTDDDMLTTILKTVQQGPGLVGTGYTDEYLASLIAPPEPIRVARSFNKPAEPVTKPGQMWKLGDHRLLCGDSTKRADVERLLDGFPPIVLSWTDPPYGVVFGRGVNQNRANAIRGDLSQSVIPVSFAVACEVLSENARIYMCGGSSNLQMAHSLFDHHLHLMPNLIVWVKDGFVMRRHNYHSQYELIFFGWKGVGGKEWHGDRKQSDVWQVARSKVTDHPTEKPLELPMRAIRNSSKRGEGVLDQFGGSGSTLDAAEQLERRCAMLEIDPGWCDVIVQRWEAVSGQKATLSS